MSSPFSKMFIDKNPVTPLQGNAFIKAKMDAEAAGKKSFVVGGESHPVKMCGSPAHKHGRLEKKLEILENDPELAEKKGLSSEGQGGKDFAAISDMKKRIEEAKAAHGSNRTEEDDTQMREDENAARGSAAEMSAIKKKTAPLEASYSNPQDYFYVSNAKDFQNLFNNITSSTVKAIEADKDPTKKADKIQRRIDNRNNRGADTADLETKLETVKKRITDTNTALTECLNRGGTYSDGKCSKP